MDCASMIIARCSVGRLVKGLRELGAFESYLEMSDHNIYARRLRNTFDFDETVSGRPILHFLNRLAYSFALFHKMSTGEHSMMISSVLLYKFASVFVSGSWNGEKKSKFWSGVYVALRGGIDALVSESECYTLVQSTDDVLLECGVGSSSVSTGYLSQVAKLFADEPICFNYN